MPPPHFSRAFYLILFGQVLSRVVPVLLVGWVDPGFGFDDEADWLADLLDD